MKKIPDYTTIYSDDDIVILNKKSGLLIAADRYDLDAPRLDLLAEKEFGKLYAVHRIDKDTSGIIIYARNPEAHKNISEQFQERKVQKVYHCLVHGRPMWNTLRVELPLMPDGDARHRTVVNKRYGKPSTTDFKVIAECGPYTWIEACPKTGRTHQIRVHMKHIGHPLFNDARYGGDKILRGTTSAKYQQFVRNCFEICPRQALHTRTLGFVHPVTGKELFFESEIPADMVALMEKWRKLDIQ